MGKAEALVASHNHLGVPLAAATLADAPASQDIVVNATSTSLAGAAAPAMPGAGCTA